MSLETLLAVERCGRAAGSAETAFALVCAAYPAGTAGADVGSAIVLPLRLAEDSLYHDLASEVAAFGLEGLGLAFCRHDFAPSTQAGALRAMA